jgi:D-3-phosphoglycerate dehydrogenase
MSGGEKRFTVWTYVQLHPAALAILEKAVWLCGPGVQQDLQDPLHGIEEADAAIVGSLFPGTEQTFKRAQKLKIVARLGMGYDNIDIGAATRAGVYVTHTPEAPTESTAEFALMLMLALARRLKQAEQHFSAGRWPTPAQVIGHDLAGKTLGLVGLGRIGGRVAELASIFRMKVVAYDPFVAAERALELGVTLVPSLSSLLEVADIVSLHVPLNSETRELMGTSELSQMKQGALLINVSRGSVVNERALIDALEKGHLSGTGLDVWDPEPPSSDNPLLHMENVIATPHIAAMTWEGRQQSNKAAAQQVLLVLRGKQPPNLLNLEAQ